MQSKTFPDNYSTRVLDIISAASMSGLKGINILGSASIRSQLYSGDFDVNNTVNMKSIHAVEEALKTIIKRLRPICYIGDIKIGELKEYQPFRPGAFVVDTVIQNFSIKESQSVIDAIPAYAITPKERSDALELLENATTPFGFVTAKKEIKFHILRWKPDQILAGEMVYRGVRVTLADAIKSGGMIKLDLAFNYNNRFIEAGIVYTLSINGKRITAPEQPLVLSLAEDFLYYSTTDPFKALKRLFSYAKLIKDKKTISVLVPILNSDLGRLYQILGDLKVLKGLLERPSPPIEDIRYQIDDMRARMGNIYSTKMILDKESNIISDLKQILRSPSLSTSKIDKLISFLQEIMNATTVNMASGHLINDKKD